MANLLRFETTSVFSLEEELKRPFEQVAIGVTDHGTLFGVRLKRQDGTALEIWSEMHDVAERLEVGVLKTQLVDVTGKRSKPFFTNKSYVTPEFNRSNEIKKLVIHEENCLAESGIIVQAFDGKRLIIVAHGFPCHIAVQGISELNTTFEPEYDLNDYKILPFSEDIANLNSVSNAG